jgi:Uma2 family endonuclease
MSTRSADYLDAIDHLPDGATLVLHQFSWDEYEQLVQQLDRPRLRVSYDRGTLQIMTPLPEHEEYAALIDLLVGALSELLDLDLQMYRAATWKRQRLARGVEADSCYYVANASRIIGKRKFDLEFDPPPDIAVEIDVTNESLSKFPIYAALGVPEIWRYDGRTARFYGLAAEEYHEIAESRFLAGLTPLLPSDALEHSKTAGQQAALRAFRQRWAASKKSR